jgi:hypothetical protein
VSNEQIKELASSWIANKGNYCPALTQLDNLCSEEPEDAWLVIQEIASREISDKIKGSLAAGPIEDLLARHGVSFIDRVETKARRDPKFNYLLGGVWQNSIRADVWTRVIKIRNKVW